MRPHRGIFGGLLVAALVVVAMGGARCGGSNDATDPPDSTFAVSTFDLAIGATVDTISGATVSPDFAAASKAQPLVGRFFVPADFAASAQLVVVLSNDLWIRRFASQASIIGSQVRLRGRDATIVGVMPPGFTVPRGVTLWVPRASP